MRRNGIAVAAALLAAASFAAAPAAAGERVKLRFDSLMDLSVSSAPPGYMYQTRPVSSLAIPL